MHASTDTNVKYEFRLYVDSLFTNIIIPATIITKENSPSRFAMLQKNKNLYLVLGMHNIRIIWWYGKFLRWRRMATEYLNGS